MPARSALRFALDLLRQPLLAGVMREQPLPSDLLLVIQAAAADEAAICAAAQATGERPERIREAAILYLQNVLLTGNPDHYRVLGVAADTPQDELRVHFTWMMKWLHPDRTRNDWDSAFAPRVLSAWNALRTPERRAAYDTNVVPVAGELASKRRDRPKVRRPRQGLPRISHSTSTISVRTALHRIGTAVAGGGQRILSNVAAGVRATWRLAGREPSHDGDTGGSRRATANTARAHRVVASNAKTDDG
jgi:hypothetical protein